MEGRKCVHVGVRAITHGVAVINLLEYCFVTVVEYKLCFVTVRTKRSKNSEKMSENRIFL